MSALLRTPIALRVQLIALGLLVSAMLGALGVALVGSPRFALVHQDRVESWIASPDPVSTGVVSAPFDRLHEVEFTRSVQLDPALAPLRLRVQALRGLEVRLNGKLLARRAWHEGDWRRPLELEVRDGLLPGENRLSVRVRNPSGPPLLRLSAEGGGVQLASDASWQTRRDDGPARSARRADDRLRAASAIPVPPVSEGLRARREPLLALAVAAGLLSLVLAGRGVDRLGSLAPLLIALAVATLWLSLLFRVALELPSYAGFDGPDHLDYVHRVLGERALPLADAGPQTYHPPLFYVTSAALLAAFPRAPEQVVLHVLPWLAGLAQVLLAYALARCLHPRDRLRQGATALAAGFLPLHLTTSVYLTNEALHGALGAAAVVATTAWLLAERPTAKAALGLGALVGLAILSKISSLLLVPIVAGFVFARRWLADGVPPGRALLPGAAAALGAVAVAGWFFVRNQLRLGQALIGNWDVPGNPIAWWQHPGFHTPAYYLRFGESLHRPFFSGFESFWDGLYTTFWGDGLLGGVGSWAARHPHWDYDFMAAGYALALPATLLGLWGFAALAAESFRGIDLRRRLALAFITTVVFVTLFAALYMTMVLPAYSMTKASYLLTAAPVLALALGEGFSRAHRALASPGLRWLRVLLHAWLGALLGAIALAFTG